MSDGSNFYDFSSIFSHYNLSNEPKNQESAAAAYIILYPRPTAIYNFLPLSLDQKTFDIISSGRPHHLPVLSPAAADMLEAMVHEDESCYKQLNYGYFYYKNFGHIMGACAHRALCLLGVSVPENLYDDPLSVNEHKWGLLPAVLYHYLSLADQDSFRLLKIDTSPERVDHTLLLSKLVQDPVFGHPAIIIFLYPGHIAWAINEAVEIRTIPAIARTITIPPDAKNKLKTMYPKNAGRAGGKILLDWDVVFSTYKHSPDCKVIIHCLLNGDNDWELVLALNLVLVSYVDVSGRFISRWLYCNSRHAQTGQSNCLFNQDFLTVVKLFKDVHTRGRMMSYLSGMLYRILPMVEARAFGDAIYGFDMLCGRSEKYKASFLDEVIMRMDDPVIRGVPNIDIRTGKVTFNRKEYDEVIKRLCSDTVNEVLKNQVSLTGFDKWYQNRLFWGASGGSPGTTAEWADGDKLRLNKRGALLASPSKDIRCLWKQADEVVQWSVGTLKFESGKLRHILTTGLYNYVTQAYLLDNFESNLRDDTWYSANHSGVARLSNHLRRLKDLRSGAAVMFDFSDYNLEHTFSVMSTLYATVASTLISRGKATTAPSVYTHASNDLEAAANYISQARHRTFLQDKQTGLIAAISRGLQSGERGTSFCNVMCNKIDSAYVDYMALKLLGRKLIAHQGDRVGDDVFTKTDHMKDAILLCALFNLSGASGQLYKINVEYCSETTPGRGEFLRYSYDGNASTVKGYPIRALVGFTHGEYFSEAVPAIFERAGTIIEQVSKLQRRGLTLPPFLVERSIYRNCSITYTSNTGKKNRVVANPALTLTPAIMGGIGVSRAQDSEALLTGGGFMVNAIHERRLSLYIPSGYSKIILPSLDSSSFVSLDEIISSPKWLYLVGEARSSGDWQNVYKYSRAFFQTYDTQGRVVIAPNPKYLDSSFKALGAVYMRDKSYLSLSKYDIGLIHSLVSKSKILLATSVSTMRGLVYSLLYQSQLDYSGQVTLTGLGSVKKRPLFSVPIESTNITLRALKSNISDLRTLNRLGLKLDISKDVIDSVISGGYSSSKLKHAIDVYAKELYDWNKSIKPVQSVASLVPSLNLDTIVSNAFTKLTKAMALRLLPSGYWSYHSGFVSNREGYPRAQRLVHNYGSIIRIIRPTGFSLGAVMSKVIDSYAPYRGTRGKAGRLLNFLNETLTRLGSEGQMRDKGQQVSTILLMRKAINSNELFLRDDNTSATLYNYLDGTLDLIPPRNYYNDSADFTSTVRDAILASLEADHSAYTRWLFAPELSRAYTLYVCEDLLVRLVHNKIYTYNHVVIKD
nr:RNA-dependent RNA polymerase [Phomopsis viticola mycovirus 962]